MYMCLLKWFYYTTMSLLSEVVYLHLIINGIPISNIIIINMLVFIWGLPEPLGVTTHDNNTPYYTYTIIVLLLLFLSLDDSHSKGTNSFSRSIKDFYDTVELLGTGGFGSVYKGRSKQNGVIVSN